jgi:hypothetical protein
MYAILPTAEGVAALKEAKERLTPEVLDNLIDSMQNKSCIVAYPKMQLSSTLQLQSALESLGLKSLFDPSTADLSILSPGRGYEDNLTDVPSFISSRSFEPSSRDKSKEANQQWTARPSGGSRHSRPQDRFVYRYKTRNYTVEQWNNGYSLRYSPRAKRQSRPIDRDFLDFLESQQLPSYGVDELRNSLGLRNPGLFAKDVIHKVEMTVNERGTEAAAVTGILLDRSGDYKRFIANRPFLFFIRHDLAKLIWFWGSINRPTPFYPSP